LEERKSLISAPVLSEYRIGMKFLPRSECCKPHVGWATAEFAHLNPVCMASFVLAKLLAITKAIRAKVDTIPYCTHWIGTFYSDRVGKIGQTAVTFCLYARFVDRCRVKV
jgi:hypothetical protein